MPKRDLEGQRALVTGASSGLGAAFARLLAARGASLVLAARREDKLKALAAELEKAHAVDVHVVAIDLTDAGAPLGLFEATEGSGRPIDVLINNAGAGLHRHFDETPWERVAAQIQLNVVSVTELMHRFLAPMLARGRGHVLNVSSIGAYTPSPTYATYSAGKAFVRDLSEAVSYELRKTPVRVCALCPGGTLTEFHQAAEHELPRAFKATFQTAEACAGEGLRALFAGRPNVVSGIINKVSMFFLRFVPRRAMVWITARTMGTPKELSGA
ncbi:MAG TPA: SDR family oxidoreductase [Minicystis sp.]|nr:SDR family oxidoreductase [Minicystis sp.]